MDLFDFIDRFPNEEFCLKYFVAARQSVGITCFKCGNDKHEWVKAIDKFECEKCGNLISVKSGTAMENSKLPIKFWFIAIQLLTSITEKSSNSEIEKKIGNDVNSDQVLKMLETLNSLTAYTENSFSFDQLLWACVKINPNIQTI